MLTGSHHSYKPLSLRISRKKNKCIRFTVILYIHFSKIPSSVRKIFFPFRINKVIPSFSSNAAICLESVGCVICNCSAAFVKLCSFATGKWQTFLYACNFLEKFYQQISTSILNLKLSICENIYLRKHLIQSVLIERQILSHSKTDNIAVFRN